MKNYMSFAIIGLGIGWLAGLSLSPVISTIISALFALVASSITLLTSVNFKQADKEQLFNNWNSSIFLMAFFMLGIIVGSSCGIYAREHNTFGLSLEKRAEMMRSVATEARKKERENLKADIEFFKLISDTYLDGDSKKTILKEFIQKKFSPLTATVIPSDLTQLNAQYKSGLSAVIPSDPIQLNAQYGKSGLYNYKGELCVFLLGQGSRLISLIDINSNEEEYNDLVKLLNKLRKEKLSDDEITSEIKTYLEKACP